MSVEVQSCVRLSSALFGVRSTLPVGFRRASLVVGLLAGTSLLTASTESRAEPSELPPLLGYNYGELETPRVAAMGGGLRALSNSTDALFVNPANMAVTRVYHLGGMVQLWPQADRQSYGGAAVDSIVSASHLAGGVGGHWTSQDSSGIDRNGYDVRLALALPLSTQLFGGATARLLSMKQNGYPRDGSALEPSIAAGGLNDQPIVREVTFDVGMTFKPDKSVALSVVGYNLTDPDNEFLPLGLAFGGGFGTDDFSLEADWLFDFTTFTETKGRAGLGGELLLADHYPLRLGYKYDQGLDIHALSFGVGYLAREFSADFALRRGVAGEEYTAIFFGLRYHLETAGVGGAH